MTKREKGIMCIIRTLINRQDARDYKMYSLGRADGVKAGKKIWGKT